MIPPARSRPPPGLTLLTRCLAVAGLLLAFSSAAPAAIDPGPAPVGSHAGVFGTAPEGTVYLSWLEPAPSGTPTVLRFSALPPDRSAWTSPRTIPTSPALLCPWDDSPELVRGSDGTFYTHWTQAGPHGDARAYSSWWARSPDGGASWSRPEPLGREFTRLAPLAEGRVLAVWLQPAAGAEAAGPAATPARELRARLFAADGSRVQDWLIEPDVCPCCRPAVTRLSGDRVLLVYGGHPAPGRHDQRFTVLAGSGWTPPRPLPTDDRKPPACSGNGPAAAARGEYLVVAWFSALPSPRVLAQYSRDGGLTFTAPTRVDLGQPLSRIDAALLPDGSAVVSWLESAANPGRADLQACRLFPDGELSAPRLLASTGAGRAGGFPRLVARHAPDLPVLFSWLDPDNGGAVRIREFRAATLGHREGAAAAAASLRGVAPPMEWCAPPLPLPAASPR